MAAPSIQMPSMSLCPVPNLLDRYPGPGAILMPASTMVGDFICYELTRYRDLAVGELNVPITGIVFAVAPFDKESWAVGLLLYDREAVVVKVHSTVWGRVWKSRLRVMQCILFAADILSGCTRSSFIIVPSNADLRILEFYPPFYKSELPVYDIPNTMVVLEVAGVLGRTSTSIRQRFIKNTKDEELNVVACRTASGEYCVLRGIAKDVLPQLVPGLSFNIGPVGYLLKKMEDEEIHVFTCYPNAVFQIIDSSPSEDFEETLECLEDTYNHRTGRKVCVSGVLICPVSNGVSYLVDRKANERSDIRPVRLMVRNIPNGDNFPEGSTVRVLASTYTHDVVILDCLEIIKVDVSCEDHVEITKEFNRYRPLLLETDTRPVEMWFGRKFHYSKLSLSDHDNPLPLKRSAFFDLPPTPAKQRSPAHYIDDPEHPSSVH